MKRGVWQVCCVVALLGGLARVAIAVTPPPEPPPTDAMPPELNAPVRTPSLPGPPSVLVPQKPVTTSPASTPPPIPTPAFPPLQAAKPAEPYTLPPEAQQWIRNTVLDAVPHEYEDTKNWGKQAEKVRGLDVEIRGLRIETRRKREQVNHGDWRLYRVELIEPEKNFAMNVGPLRADPAKGVACDIQTEAWLNCTARMQRWQNGIQLISLTTQARAKVRAKMACSLSIRLDVTRFPPDVILVPRVSAIDIEVLEFKVDRVGKLHGPLIYELGKSLREFVEDKIDDREAKLVAKINDKLEKKKDKLRISAGDYVKARLDEIQKLPGK